MALSTTEAREKRDAHAQEAEQLIAEAEGLSLGLAHVTAKATTATAHATLALYYHERLK